MTRHETHAAGAAIGYRCHAGAGHGWAKPRGLHGWLCQRCWDAVERLLARVR